MSDRREFKVGDRVVGRYERFKEWGVGTIRAMIATNDVPPVVAYAVEFDEPIHGHDCWVDGIPTCKPEHGWWFTESYLEAVEVCPGDKHLRIGKKSRLQECLERSQRLKKKEQDDGKL